MDDEFKYKTPRARVVKRAFGVGVVALCIGLAGFTCAKQIDRENGYKSVAKDFIMKTYESEDNSLFLGEYNDDYVLPKYQEETIVSLGKYIEQEIEDQGILYCEFLDEYYTKNGMPIALIDTYLSEEGKACYRTTVVLDDLEEPFTLKDNQNITIINTKPYSELKDMRLVVEMPTEKVVLSGQEELYEGSLRLKK
jgi:hypothetical protein